MTRICKIISTVGVGALALALQPALAADPVNLGAAGYFAILGLADHNCTGCQDASITINSATTINGNVGYGAGTTSGTNQKVGTFNGTALVSSTAAFTDTSATFQPTGGILTGSAVPGIGGFPTVDALLNQANADALAASTAAAALPTTL